MLRSSFFKFAGRCFVFATASVLCSCSHKAPSTAGGGAPSIQIDVLVIQPDSFSFTTDAVGNILAQEFVELKPEVSGRITHLNFKEGSFVEAGALLVKLVDDDLQAQLKKFKSQLEIAETTLSRFKKLLDLNGMNQQEYDQALNTVNTLRADVDLINAQIRKTEIRAPFSGMIGLRNVSVGALITSQDVVATLQQTNTLKLDFVLPESQGNSLRPGDLVKVKASNDDLHSAKILAIEPQVLQGNRNRKFRAEILESAKLNPGAFVSVIISNDQGTNAILIPTNCVIPESRNKKVALIKNGKVKFQIVETGHRGQELIQITSGLAIGDTIATSGLMFLKPEGIVQIRSVK
jgi:membrane fusion protein (multidrug efflux system)